MKENMRIKARKMLLMATLVLALAGGTNAASNPARGYIDEPANNAQVKGKTDVTGWALVEPGEKTPRLELRVDGKPIAELEYNVPRPDVCAAFPMYRPTPPCPNNGFQINVDFSKFNPGLHTVSVTLFTPGPRTLSATLIDDRVVELSKKYVTVE